MLLRAGSDVCHDPKLDNIDLEKDIIRSTLGYYTGNAVYKDRRDV